ncbi:hypothetical protein D0B54_03740 [Solimonas sp. K1W22B-7]|uniref:hypothetical protein n=1 Tax=Solimonas sp. K1W22B-7 TaxID=2303331 RepID=UPI000E32E6D9|nr:hypothetical protein [Solimonas sp. K1W22B-7]AXQ27841.1 hypothetical protein D0B54_03740 [Solimonas sp. K1W22B-7]
MKKIIIIVVIALVVGFLMKKKPQAEAADAAIVNPVYAETRITFEVPGASIEGVLLGIAKDEAECEMQNQILQSTILAGCQECKTKKTECWSKLEPRYAKLFQNKPAATTYLSLAKGSADEREHRMLFWGITVPQSDMICDSVASMQRSRKGEVQCIRAPR